MQWRIYDFLEGAPTLEPRVRTYYWQFFAENCMKIKEIGLREECIPSLPWICH